MAWEFNFDRISGPTHNFGGLSFGDIASMESSQKTSNPQLAALQGLSKMHLLFSLGIKQGILPPQERPFIPVLHSLGFSGTDEEILSKAWKFDPKLVIACSSSAFMWTANAATVSPSIDSNDRRVHFTPANLVSQFHRSFEAGATGFLLTRIFEHPAYFAHHRPLPYHADFADEGAANHTRLCAQFDRPGVHLFVYGRPSTSNAETMLPKRFPARQTEAASRACARLHRLNHVVFAQQNPEAIDAGVFHNDVISTGHQNLFLYHEKAFVNTASIISQLKTEFEAVCQIPLKTVEVKEAEVSIQEAVKCYLFNSQIVTLEDQSMVLIAPQECQNSDAASNFLNNLITDSSQPIRRVVYQNIQESMQNGGGPACLRLRVVLNKNEADAMNPHVIFSENLFEKLEKWIKKHFRDRLSPGDLGDPQLLTEGKNALEEISYLLQLGPLYSFQRMGGVLPPLPEKR